MLEYYPDECYLISSSWLFISMVLSAVAKTYLLTSFGRAVGSFSDLAMCMALA